MKTVSPTVEFLDDICSVDRYTKCWNLIKTLNFGYWVYQDEPEKVLYQISSMSVDIWEKEKDIHHLSQDTTNTICPVRNICGTKFRMVYLSRFKLPFWVNIVYPKENPLDLRKVKFEAYNNESAALADAEAERAWEDQNCVFTKKVETEIMDVMDYIKEDTLKITDHRGLIETEVVKEYIDENSYLRRILREMLRIIPKEKLKEFQAKLDVKIPEGVDKDSLEEDFEEEFIRIGKLIDKAYDVFEKARPPVSVLPPNNSHTAMDKNLWYGKRDTILEQLMEYSIKKQSTTMAALREAGV